MVAKTVVRKSVAFPIGKCIGLSETLCVIRASSRLRLSRVSISSYFTGTLEDDRFASIENENRGQNWVHEFQFASLHASWPSRRVATGRVVARVSNRSCSI